MTAPHADDPLIEACKTANMTQLRQWVESGDDVSRPLGNEGFNGLVWVIRGLAADCVLAAELLMAHGISPCQRDGRMGNTPLHWATGLQTGRHEEGCPIVSKRRAELITNIQRACAAKGNPWPVNAYGLDVLRSAVLRNSSGLVQLMIDLGADISATDKEGDTALHVAYRHMLLDSAKTLHANWKGDMPSNVKNETPAQALYKKKKKNRVKKEELEAFILLASIPTPLPAPPLRRL